MSQPLAERRIEIDVGVRESERERERESKGEKMSEILKENDR